MKATTSILLGIVMSILVLSTAMTPTQVNQVNVITDDVLLPAAQSEVAMDVYTYPMTIAGRTVYYATNYLLPQSNIVKKSEIHAYAIDDARQELIYSIEFDNSEAGGISYLDWSDGHLFWVEVDDPWKLVGFDLSEMKSFIVRDSETSSQVIPPSFQVIADRVYWFESNVEGESILYSFDPKTKQMDDARGDAPFYLASPYSRLPASQKDLCYLTSVADTIWFNRVTDEEPLSIDTTLSTVELAAVSDKYAFFADKALNPKLYLMTLNSGRVEAVLEDVDIKSVRSAIIIGDDVLLDMSQGSTAAVYVWRIGDQELIKVATETEWLRRSEDGLVFGVIPDSEVDQTKYLAGIRIIKVSD